MNKYLYWDERTAPKLRYFSTCKDSIRTIPSLVHDELHPEDVDTDGEDHAADALRYGLRHAFEGSSRPGGGQRIKYTPRGLVVART